MSGFNRKPRKSRVSGSGTSSSGSSSRNPFAGGTPITPRDTSSTDPLYRDPHGSSGVRNDAVLPSSSIDKLLAQSGESNVLGNLGKNTDPNGFLQMLLNIGADNVGVSPDVQKALYDMYLQYLMKQEQRNYDESQLANERLYTSPTNQLARLMGAGISRDAAIQMLNGTGSSDSPLIGSGADITAPDTGLSPSEKRNMIAGNIISGIGAIAGAIGSLGSFGLSAAMLGTNMAATKAATAGQMLSNEQFKRTLDGINTASTVIGAISSAVDAGVLPSDVEFGSTQAMVKTIRDNADKYEPFKALVDSGTMDGIMKDVYSLTALNNGYKQWRESKDFNIDRSHYVRMYALDELAKEVDIDLAGSEVAANYQSIDESINRMLNDNLRVGIESSLADANIDKMVAETYGLELQNQILQVDADFMTAGAKDINAVRLGQLALESACWKEFDNNPEMKKRMIEGWLMDKDNARTAVALESIYLNDEFDTQTALHDVGNGDGHPIRKAALFWHNMFQYGLNPSQPNAADQGAKELGRYAKSAVMMFLTKKP